MSDVGAPQRLFAGAPGGTAASGSSGRVVNPPADLLQPGGEARPGVVAGRDARGLLLVKGDFGKGPVTLAIATAARFAAGAAVSLNFRPHVSGLFVSIVPRTAPDGQRAAATQPQAAPAAARAPDVASLGAVPAPGNGRTAAAPPAGGQTGSRGPGDGSPWGGGQDRGQDHGQDHGRGPAVSASRPAAPAGPLAGALPGVVEGHDAEGRLLVRGSFGRLAVDTPARIPGGTRVLLQVASGGSGPVATLFAEPRAGAAPTAPLRPLGFGTVGSAEARPAPAPPSAPALGSPAPLARVWPTLTVLVEAFAEAQGTPLAPLLPAGFPPKVGPRLALSLLRYIQAAEGQGLLAWLGATGQAGPLATHQALAPGRLQEADEELRWLARDPPGDWRLVLLPLVGQGPPEALRFFLKKRGAPGEGDAPAPTHFLCDLALSRLGALQLEGLLREARFDLVLRSRRPLHDGLREELTGIFVAASEAGGLGGSFRFQAGDDWLPLPVPHPQGEAGLSV